MDLIQNIRSSAQGAGRLVGENGIPFRRWITEENPKETRFLGRTCLRRKYVFRGDVESLNGGSDWKAGRVNWLLDRIT